MKKFSGQAWHGPIAGAICSTCNSARPTRYGQTWVNELCEFRASELVKRLGVFQCGGCSEQEHADYKAKRKAELAAEPRCQVPGCSLRGSWRAGSYDPVLLCGRHLKAAQSKHQANMSSVGGIGLFLGAEVSGANVLAMVEGKSE